MEVEDIIESNQKLHKYICNHTKNFADTNYDKNVLYKIEETRNDSSLKKSCQKIKLYMIRITKTHGALKGKAITINNRSAILRRVEYQHTTHRFSICCSSSFYERNCDFVPSDHPQQQQQCFCPCACVLCLLLAASLSFNWWPWPQLACERGKNDCC
jgi:hypothetical protein